MFYNNIIDKLGIKNLFNLFIKKNIYLIKEILKGICIDNKIKIII